MKGKKLISKVFLFIMALVLFSSIAVINISAAAPAAPSSISATSSTSSIKLTWQKVKGATGYRIYYKLPGDLSWRTIVSSTTATTYTFKKIPEGQSYEFAVKSYTKTGNKTVWGNYARIVTATQTSAPKNITVKQSTNSIKLTWSEVGSATGYRIYYKTSADSSWKTLVSGTKYTDYTVKNLSSGKKYFFAIRSYSKSSLGTFYGKYSTVETVTKPATPVVKATAEYSKVTLKWNKVSGAAGYRVYYKSGSSWKTAVSSTTKTAYTFKNLSGKSSYTFAVKAYVKISSGIVWGSYKEIKVKCTELADSPVAKVALELDYKVPSNFKIGFICVHDETSSYDSNFISAAEEIKNLLGLKHSQVILKVNVPETNEAYVAAKDLVKQGCKIIFANSFNFEDFIIKAAKEFPNVEFCHVGGIKAHTEGLDNYHNAYASIYEGRYLSGIAAGLKLNEMIENGEITAKQAKMGYVGAYTYAEIISGYTAFYLGAKSVCPSVTMDVQFTGSWYDVTEEKNAAEALIARGCKLISQHADSMGAPGACEYAGVPNVSYNGSTYDACPETFLVSSAINWTPYYNYIIGQYCKGKKIATDWCGGLAEGSVVLSKINMGVAAPGTYDALNAASKQIINGKIKVFDTSKFTVNKQKVNSYVADVDSDAMFKPDTQVISGGSFLESAYRSAPYFDLRIDGITLLNEKF